MGKWFRCPICNKLSLAHTIGNDFPIEVFNQVGLGRAKGFRYDRITDIGIVSRIKNRIKVLYERFFVNPEIRLLVPVSPSMVVNEIPSLRVSMPVSIKTKVKMIE